MHPPELSDDDDEKLIPEWQASADDQVLWAGLAVVAALGLLFAWQTLFGSDEVGSDPLAADLIERVPTEVREASDDALDRTGLSTSAGAAADGTAAGAADTTAGTDAAEAATDPTPTSTSTSAAPTPTVDEATLQAATGTMAGAVTAAVGAGGENPVVLTGVVANDAEAAAAVAAADAVEGVDEVIDQLDRLEPEATRILSDAKVVDAVVGGEGTVLTVTGVLQREDDRPATIAAVRAIPGVTDVVDGLTVSVAAALNELPTVPFRTGSDEILAGGQDIVAEAAALINGADGLRFEVQGYTDTVGDQAANLQLSNDRAAAVAAALVASGVDADRLEAKGFGETDQFGAGDSTEALAANRVVRFEQVD